MKIRSLRARFAIWTTLLILVLMTGFGTFVYFNLSRSLTSAVDDSLIVSAAQAVGGLNIQDGYVTIPEALSAEENTIMALSERGLTVIVLASDGKIIQTVGPFRDTAIDPSVTLSNNPQGTFLTLSDRVEENDPLRAYVLPVLDNGKAVGWVQVIQSLGPAQDALNQLLTALLLGGAVLLLFAALGGYFLSARALEPIDRITQTAQQIAGGEDLSARLDLPDNGDEISRLAATFDAMLARLDDSFHRERQFTADASHELRTPLTAMQAILGVIREGERPVGEYRQALDDLDEETNRLRGLVEDLLHLARGEADKDLVSENISLTNLLGDVADSLRPLVEAKGLELIVDVPENLTLYGDTDALIRLFVNLIDNSIKYTEQGRVTVAACNEQDMVIVNVVDTGIGMQPQHLERIFDRFYRVDLARSSGGAGLGLAIARQIVRAHNGRLDVHSEPGKGSTFTVSLPN